MKNDTITILTADYYNLLEQIERLTRKNETVSAALRRAVLETPRRYGPDFNTTGDRIAVEEPWVAQAKQALASA